MIGTESAAALQTGLALGVASMASIGPNSLMLIREGLSDGRVGTIATTVWTSYVVLLAGAFVLADSADLMGPVLRASLTWSGFAAICAFAFLAFRSAARADVGDGIHIESKTPRPRVVKALSIVWLNPLTYLEFLLIPAVLFRAFPSMDARLQFVGSFLLMAAVACYGYGFAGRLLAPLLKRRTALRAFDLMSGVLLTGIAIAMAAALFTPAADPSRQSENAVVQIGSR